MMAKDLIRTEEAKQKALHDLEKQFDLSTDQLKRISELLQAEMKTGLKKEDTNCNVPMLPSWICSHPSGQEKGEYLGLDLSGSYIRVYLVTLHGQGRITTRQLKYTVKEDLKVGPVNNLIDFMAECVDSFLTFVNKGDSKNPLSLGLCISFPLHQTAINNAYILRWTKDFEITGADNKNMVELLQTSFRKRELPVIVKAAVNGASGCLLAHSYRSLDTLLACTVSTGTNAAYWEKIDDIEKISNKAKNPEQEMIINTEWGSFGDTKSETIPHTFYDIRVNRQSVNPGVHVYEKMCAGLYLGEIVRLILVDFTDRRLLFDAQYSSDLNKAYNFESAYMSAIERDETDELEDTKHLLENVMNLKSTTLTDRKMVKRICELVGRRAARLVAAGMSAIVSKRNALDGGLTISVEGTIYEHYSNFPDRVNAALRELYGDSVERINIGIARDGNGIGAALAAMLASEA
ncbi:hexokinase-domain-containing protein [Cokeromyces recurvatus]|uniref:hexokinase-domain-containing protein n=1 Tax=Cokeromyces recurvatus TaxID=90255 RepID=UPI0022203386|nr:hexokinase-domain-containing protein [Cokeromyces recurvatus]KAI7907719.1 hexokinase-domain-containing protein [Cokeromyces recurvatus]